MSASRTRERVVPSADREIPIHAWMAASSAVAVKSGVAFRNSSRSFSSGTPPRIVADAFLEPLLVVGELVIRDEVLFITQDV